MSNRIKKAINTMKLIRVKDMFLMISPEIRKVRATVKR